MFTQNELDFIEFGKLTLLKSMKDMREEGDDLNGIDFGFLINKVIRNIQNPILLDSIKMADESTDDDYNFGWREKGV
jgi:hypothetical protein